MRPTRIEKVKAIKARWDKLTSLASEIGNVLNELSASMSEMESILVDEDARSSKQLIAELIRKADGKTWCAFAFRPDARKELMEQLGDSENAGRVEAIAKDGQRYPVYLFFGQQGRDLLQRYLNDDATEDDVMDATQAAL